jgi:hypothetical protein
MPELIHPALTGKSVEKGISIGGIDQFFKQNQDKIPMYNSDRNTINFN